jgi:hypothetical protein
LYHIVEQSAVNNSNNHQDELLKFNWEYKSKAQTSDFRHLWQFSFGDYFKPQAIA